MENVELLAAQTLLEKGVSLPVKAPFFLRLLGFRQLKIYQPSAGNYLRINSLYLKMNIKDEELQQTSLYNAKKLEIKHTYTHCRMLVFALFKGYLTPVLLNRIMGKWLLWNLKQKQIMDIAEILLVLGGTTNFMNTTRLIREMRLTTPTNPNLGHPTQRS